MCWHLQVNSSSCRALNLIFGHSPIQMYFGADAIALSELHSIRLWESHCLYIMEKLGIIGSQIRENNLLWEKMKAIQLCIFHAGTFEGKMETKTNKKHQSPESTEQTRHPPNDMFIMTIVIVMMMMQVDGQISSYKAKGRHSQRSGW